MHQTNDANNAKVTVVNSLEDNSHAVSVWSPRLKLF